MQMDVEVVLGKDGGKCHTLETLSRDFGIISSARSRGNPRATAIWAGGRWKMEIIRKTSAKWLKCPNRYPAGRRGARPLDVSRIGRRYITRAGRSLGWKTSRCWQTPGGAETRAGAKNCSTRPLPRDASAGFRLLPLMIGRGGFVSFGIISAI